MRSDTTTQRWQVAILGTGLAGSALAAILARHGIRVLLLDERIHPRFAVGETVIPRTAMLFRILGKRYQVPELGDLAGFNTVTSKVSKQVGLGRSVGFIYYGQDGFQDPAHLAAVSTPRQVPTEANFYRQDIDASIFYAAIRYGATARQARKITDLEFGADGARITTGRNEIFEADFVVDASGTDSILERQLSLPNSAAPPCRVTRSGYTHMVKVRPLDEIVGTARSSPAGWDSGTTYHLFDGGYFWTVPFGNYPQSVNLTTSVGYCVDADRIRAGDNAQTEFTELLKLVPLLKAQLRAAQPVQRFHLAERRGARPPMIVGDRWCLLSTSSSGPDGLFSRSLSCDAELVNVLAERLIEAVRRADYRGERFAQVQLIGTALANGTDAMNRMLLDSLCSPQVFMAALKVITLGTMLGTFQLSKVHGELTRYGYSDTLRQVETSEHFGSYFPGHAGYAGLLSYAARQCADAAARRIDARAAAERILREIGASDFAPLPFGFADATARFYHPGALELVSVLGWSVRRAEPQVGELVRTALLSGFNPLDAVPDVLKQLVARIPFRRILGLP
jgi:tetracycline 7-halogenase / FADH2 O2-dependent halogenase